jgi:AraC-like DNA-binding protein
LIAVLEGDVTIKLENKTYNLSKNQSIIIPPLQYHTIIVNSTDCYRRVTALFELSNIPSALQEKWLSNNYNAIVSNTQQAEKLKNICQSNSQSQFLPLAESIMIEILYDSIFSTNSDSQSNSDTFLQSAINYIDKHIYEKIILGNIAKHMLCSKSTFCHVFGEKMGVSPKQYIIQKKLALANKLLKDGIPSTDIAIKLGYDNYSNFYRSYLRQYGITPTVYKKNH